MANIFTYGVASLPPQSLPRCRSLLLVVVALVDCLLRCRRSWGRCCHLTGFIQVHSTNGTLISRFIGVITFVESCIENDVYHRIAFLIIDTLHTKRFEQEWSTFLKNLSSLFTCFDIVCNGNGTGLGTAYGCRARIRKEVLGETFTNGSFKIRKIESDSFDLNDKRQRKTM